MGLYRRFQKMEAIDNETNFFMNIPYLKNYYINEIFRNEKFRYAHILR